MPQLSLAWTVADGPGGNQDDPRWEDVDSRLQTLKARSGTVALDLVNPPEIGPQGLQVFCDQGNFLLMLSELTADDHEVRGYTNASADHDGVGVLGNAWDGRMVCQDFEIVRTVFAELFTSGDVARTLLS
jgi:hypothetical protein